MIKFFRHIRKKLLEENRLSKYLVYAFGEIILVVIGILLALQINVWQNTYERTKSNKIYITKIVEELKLNKERLDYLAFKGDTLSGRPGIEAALNNCRSLLKLSAKGFDKSDLDFILNTNIYAGGSQLSLFDATYEELLNTGKLYTLGSDHIISAIKKYYKRYESEIAYNKRWTDYALQGYNKTESSLGKLILDYQLNPEAFSITDYPWYFQPKSTKYTNLQLGVTRLRNGQAHDLRKCKELIKDSDALITILEKELERNYN